jgi:hypothetical protein
MDKRVFGYHKFSIIDSNLFKENGKKATKIELTAAAANPTNGNLWEYVEFCQDVSVTFNDCPYLGHCSGPGGSCDNCAFCTSEIAYSYCWGGWINTGGGGGGGGTTTTGGGGSGGSPMPPSSCQGGGGTTPIPTIPDEPSLPATLIRVDYSTIIDPCLISVIHNIGLEGHGSYILKTYFDQNLNLNGPQKKYHIKYLTNTTLTGDNGQPVPGKTMVTTLADGSNQVQITLNPSLFQNTTKEWVTTVILHELLHGIISVEKPNLTTNRQQHTWMFDNLVPITIAQSLRELFPTINDYDAIALGLDGMSEGYLISGTNTIDPTKDAFAQQNYFQNLNQAITSASNYRDAVAGFGKSFC